MNGFNDFSTFKSEEPGMYVAPPTGSLSFNFDEDEEEEDSSEDEGEKEKKKSKHEDISVFKRFKKNPNVDTSFLPDANRDVSKCK